AETHDVNSEPSQCLHFSPIVLCSKIVRKTVHFHGERPVRTEKVHNKFVDWLLSVKIPPSLSPLQMVPQQDLGNRTLTTKLPGQPRQAGIIGVAHEPKLFGGGESCQDSRHRRWHAPHPTPGKHGMSPHPTMLAHGPPLSRGELRKESPSRQSGGVWS